MIHVITLHYLFYELRIVKCLNLNRFSIIVVLKMINNICFRGSKESG